MSVCVKCGHVIVYGPGGCGCFDGSVVDEEIEKIKKEIEDIPDEKFIEALKKIKKEGL